MVQSENPISINSFLTEVGRDLHYNILNQQNFFDIFNNLCRKVPIISKLFKFDQHFVYLRYKSSTFKFV